MADDHLCTPATYAHQHMHTNICTQWKCMLYISMNPAACFSDKWPSSRRGQYKSIYNINKPILQVQY